MNVEFRHCVGIKPKLKASKELMPIVTSPSHTYAKSNVVY